MKIRLASRESVLAVIQSEMVMANIAENFPEVELELETMKTTGDMILDRTLDKVGGKGLFVKELDMALKEKRADLTVHSFKDMPMEESEELPILAISKREDPRDALILPEGVNYEDMEWLKSGLPIGSASYRRQLQLEEMFPGVEVKPIRGNVYTRLEKLDRGEYCATVLAYSGLKRLNMEHRASKIFEPEEMLPAACQGILSVQGRADFDMKYLENFHDEEVAIVAKAERSFVRTLEGGCSSPVAAYATTNGDEITLTGFYVDANMKTYRETVVGNKHNGEELGKNLALKMKSGCK